MEFENPTNGENQASEDACNRGEGVDPGGCFPDDIDSACSTPYVSAPSSPGRGAPNGYFYSAPASPMHFVLSSSPYSCAGAGKGVPSAAADGLVSGSFEFEFSARFGGTSSGAAALGAMISADELFLNGQIRPMNLSSHLQRPQLLAPLLDLEAEEDEEASDYNEERAVRGRDLKMRNRSLRRRARSMSPLRNPPFQWHDEGEERSGERSGVGKGGDADLEAEPDHMDQLAAATPSVSASSSRSSSTSSSRSSKRWVFLKDLLYRSKSEGRGNAKDKFWNAISFSPSKERSSYLFFRDRFTKPSPAAGAPPPTTTVAASSPAPSESQKPKHKSAQSSAAGSTTKKPSSASSRPANGVGKRRVSSQSAHERHYTANRAQAEEMRKKTFLPYRQGLLGCLGFSSRSYGAMNGLARTLNPVSSR